MFSKALFLFLGTVTGLAARADNLYSVFDFFDPSIESRYFEANYHRGGENSRTHRAVGPVLSGYCRATLKGDKKKSTISITLSDFSEKKICPYSLSTRRITFDKCLNSTDPGGPILCQSDVLLKNRWNQEPTDRVVELRVYTEEGPYYGTLLLGMAKTDEKGSSMDSLVNEVPLIIDPTH